MTYSVFMKRMVLWAGSESTERSGVLGEGGCVQTVGSTPLRQAAHSSPRSGSSSRTCSSVPMPVRSMYRFYLVSMWFCIRVKSTPQTNHFKVQES